MYKVIRTTFIAALLLLATVVETQFAVEAQVAVADGEVEWTTSTGEAADSAKPDFTAAFHVNGDALETTKTGRATWTGLSGTVATHAVWNVTTGTIGTGAVMATFALDASGYASTSPASTPFTAFPTVTAGGVAQFVGSSDLKSTFALLAPTAQDVVATFNHHVVDSWNGQDEDLRRAKVTSTSDPQGEFVTISEVASVGDTTGSATSNIFRGSVLLSADAATQGINDDGVWVQDGDVLTVSYLDADGTTLDTDTVTVDGVTPTIGNVSPPDGTVTNTANPTITFDVTDQGSGIAATPGTVIGLEINGNAVDATKISFQPIVDGFRGFFAQGTDWTKTVALGGFGVNDSVKFSLKITATDRAGNVKEVSGADAEVTIDQTAPTLLSAKTGTDNTAVVVTFSEDLADASVDASDITVGGSAASAAVLDIDDDDTGENVVTLTVSALAPDAKPEVKVVGTLADSAGNEVVADSLVTASDGIEPGMTVTIDKALAIEDDAVKITVVTTEKLGVEGLKVSVNGPVGQSTAAVVVTTAPTPQNNEGTFTVASGDGTGIYGVSIQASDGSNASNNLTAVTDEEISAKAGDTVLTLGNGPIGDLDFDGDLDKADITALLGGSVTSTDAIASIDASARTITLNAAVVADSTIKVSYHYVAADTFQIDQAAPTVTFEPKQDDKVRNQSPFIRVIFDEDEYPGDSFTTVTLTKAEVVKPDASTENVLANFFTSDDEEFIWAAANLALGAYKLTVSAVDTAGNEIEDATVDFTVEKRTVTVGLRPGWNLVSLPDAPEDNAINAVITSLAVDVVLTYDPTTPQKWLNATRGDDGPLSGTLSTIDASRAYWVHTGTFVDIVTNIGGLQAGQPGLPPSYNLVAGWNLVAVSTPNIDDTTRVADAYFTGLAWSRAYGYNNATNAFEGVLPDDGSDLNIGQGYWLFLKSAGTLVP